jgi:anti-sigma factor RsiW
LVEHLTRKQSEDYCRQQLGVAELLSVSDHLGECETCRRQVESAMNGDAAFFALRAELFDEAAEVSLPHAARGHLTAEQAALFVDGDLSGEGLREVADHLGGCEQCALTVADLRTFRDEVAPTLGREYRPASVPAPVVGWWHRAAASVSAFLRHSPASAFGAAAAVLLLAVAGWLLWRTQWARAPRQEVVVAPAPAPQTSPFAAPAPEPQPSPTTAATAAVVAQLNDGGGQLRLDAEGKLSGADDLPPAYRSLLKEALASRRVERSSQLKGLTRPSSPLMGADEQGGELSLLGPAGKVLTTDRPTFNWTPLGGAATYVVEVYDDKFNPVIASPQLTGHSWTASRPLPRGGIYSWQVKAIKDGQEFEAPRPPAAQARFRILARAKADELAKAKRNYPSSHLTLGLLYAEAGLLEEAERELRLLQKANPGSEVARRLLAQIQALRRRGE